MSDVVTATGVLYITSHDISITTVPGKGKGKGSPLDIAPL